MFRTYGSQTSLPTLCATWSPKDGELHRRGLLRGNGSQLHHAVDHVVPARLELRTVLRERVGAGLLDQGGDDRILRRAEPGHRLVEVGLRRGLHAVCPVAEVDRVEVVGQDPLLGLLLADLHRHEDLLDLAADRLLGADALVVVPDELLGDGRAALQRVVVAGEVREGGPHGGGGRDAALGPEVAVLRGQHRVDDAGHLLELAVSQHLPVGAAEPPDQRAVAGVDDGLRVAGSGHGLGRDRRLLVSDGDRDGAQDDERADDAEQNAQGLPPGPVAPPAALDLDPGSARASAPRAS